MTITKLTKATQKRAAAVAAAAFFDYPMMCHYFPDAAKRRRALPWYLYRTLTCAMRYGEALAAQDCAGVMFTLPPGHVRLTDAEYIKCGFLLVPLVMGFGNYKRSTECERFVADTHERLMDGRAHYYLWGLVADPAAQRSGVGKALLKMLTDKADAAGVPVYLETHESQNVTYYERFGFALVCETVIPTHGLDLWCMVREPCVSQVRHHCG